MRKREVLYGNKRLITLFLALVLCLVTGSTPVQATYRIDSENEIVDGFTPPENETIIHHVTTGAKAYTKIANKVETLYLGEHHRFTVVANKRENVKITWTSSNPEIVNVYNLTGEVTALSIGTATITMRDSENKTKQTCKLTVKAKPVLPEVPRAWYDVEDTSKWMCEEGKYQRVVGVNLVFKPEYEELYEQCTMLQIPEYVDGKRVLGLKNHTNNGRLLFKQLKAIQGTGDVIGIGDNDGALEMVLYSEDTERMLVNNIGKIARIPEKTKIINVVHFSSPKLTEVRIPMNVKVIW